MKLNVTIDLSEIYDEGDEASVKQLILADLNREVGNSVRMIINNQLENIKIQVKNTALEIIANSIENKIPEIAGELIGAKFFGPEYKIKKYNTEYSVKEYVENVIDKKGDLAKESIENFISNENKKTTERLEKQAQGIFNDIHKKYDLLFASQIVSKLGEKGMLKEDVAKLLLD